ncbi:DUF1992 domain-containing protein [Arthrobacter sp. NPDC097144]|uniref:DnaJ family domain-containing protein n=1 Tax=Arthrobacter sp. NPDC097144 TaxID=3363946 RepID=UPI00380E096A
MAGSGAEAYRKRLEQAARLKAAGTSEAAGYKVPEGLGASESEEAREKRRKFTEAQKADYLVRDAMNRGEFDNLRYAGKPIPGLDDPDPDWWIKRLIKRENISGLGPPALLLRVEDENFASRLDELPSERQVRDAVEDFNSRVIEARRQLLGGPPVITRIRGVEDEVRSWRERRGLSAVSAEGDAAEGDAAARPAAAGRSGIRSGASAATGAGTGSNGSNQRPGLRGWVHRLLGRFRRPPRHPRPDG